MNSIRMNDKHECFKDDVRKSMETPEPIKAKFARVITINTWNDLVSRKDVLFGGLENKILHLDPIFHQKRKFLTGLRKFRVKESLNNGVAHL